MRKRRDKGKRKAYCSKKMNLTSLLGNGTAAVSVDENNASDVDSGGDLETFKYYSEGVVLTPISVFGIFGEENTDATE